MSILYHSTRKLDSILDKGMLLCIYGRGYSEEPRRNLMNSLRNRYERMTSEMADLARTELTDALVSISLADEELADEAQKNNLGSASKYKELKRIGFIWLGNYQEVEQINRVHNHEYMLELDVPCDMIKKQGLYSLVWGELSLDYLKRVLVNEDKLDETRSKLDDTKFSSIEVAVI